jgi:hypothetical protein
VSNWGAQALAAGVCLLRDQTELLAKYDVAFEQQALQAVVREGRAVDGMTGLPNATVDGLPLATALEPWAGMRRVLSLPQ